MMTGSLHRKTWANDMAKQNTNERSPLKIVGAGKPYQWSIEAWNMMPPYALTVTSKPLYILSDIPDERETIFVLNDKSPKDKASEMVKNYLEDKELNELILRQFLQPHISNPRALAKYIDRLEAKIRVRDAKAFVEKITSPFTCQVYLCAS